MGKPVSAMPRHAKTILTTPPPTLLGSRGGILEIIGEAGSPAAALVCNCACFGLQRASTSRCHHDCATGDPEIVSVLIMLSSDLALWSQDLFARLGQQQLD